jgi:hypothetical protein
MRYNMGGMIRIPKNEAKFEPRLSGFRKNAKKEGYLIKKCSGCC